MRIKTFTAPTMADAMEQVRDVMGDEAIIIATQEDKKNKTVEVRAAIERLPQQKVQQKQITAPSSEDMFIQELKSELATHAPHLEPHLTKTTPSPETDPERKEAQDRAMKRLLTFHGCSQKLGTALLSAYTAIEEDSLQQALTRILELRFPMDPLPIVPKNPLMLIGAAGAGKTAIAAKLAARAILAGADAYLITTDVESSGALAKIAGLAEVMGRTVITAETPEDLQARIKTLPQNAEQPAAIIIDTPSVNPYDSEEIQNLQHFLQASNAEPVLVLAAGGDRNEVTDYVDAFSAFGIQRVIITRLDSVRRLGSTLSAIDASLMTLSHFSDSAYVGRGFERFTPDVLAERLLSVPQRVPDHQPYYSDPINESDAPDQRTQVKRAIS